ncbi:protein tyrosine phosphatase [Bifidobacterium sp. UTCIF-37]|uniref:arsenate reductase/protein-tyrosine-phosphatase family protein n=1 Tax=unclassified Bifidobacterium TaxID=2608897 RepID=UPI00112D26EE|nr:MULTISPECIES: protein tyrosine phosphatase [unclassified Bifidobacterium]TPF85332.1 protein tyrosine phosphatase [Bifidobacterium sp. UTCIF-37]TPF87286.1 protein tyrosine phosphatase [Bifidobacterium sp. UTCIF-38]
MQILYVCTGNQCRSVMAEYYTRSVLAARGLDNEDLDVRSAGTLHYPPHPADPLAIDMLKADGIDANPHVSTPLTADLSRTANLILCFEREQISDLLDQNPLAARKVFLFNDFVNVCSHLHADGPIPGDTVGDRLNEVMASVSMLRPFLPEAPETEDPHRKSREVFVRVYAEIKKGVNIIFDSVA